MKSCLILSLLALAACGQSNGNGFNGDGLSTAVYSPEDRFTDIQICNEDVHQLPNGQVYMPDSSPVSQTDNTNYSQASDGYFVFPTGGPQGQDCWFYVTGGQFDPTMSSANPRYGKVVVGG